MSESAVSAVVDTGAGEEDVVRQVVHSLEQLAAFSTAVTAAIDERASALGRRVASTSARIAAIDAKIEAVKASKQATAITSPSTYPVPTSQELTFTYDTNIQVPVVKPVLPPDRFITTDEAYQKVVKGVPKMYYNVRAKDRPREIDDLPPLHSHIADLFVFNTSLSVPQWRSVMRDKFWLDESKPRSKRLRKSVINTETAKTVGQDADEQAQDPVDRLFSAPPDLTDVPQLDLPDILPNLGDDIITDLFSAITSPLEASFSGKTADPQPSVPATISSPPPSVSATTKTPTPPASAPLPSQPVAVVAPPGTVPPPPPAPPPPPPAAPPPPPPVASLAPAASGDAGRASLMEAIRQAGGTGGLKLKPKRRHRESSKTTAAAPESTSAKGGGDLMSDLSKALELRRRAITGKSAPPAADMTGVLERVAAQLPLPTQGSDSDETHQEDEAVWSD